MFVLVFFPVEFNIPENIVWLKANVNQSGFYRVTYSEDMWMSIIAALKKDHSVFSPADRASLIDDVFTLCRYIKFCALIAQCLQWKKF